MSLWGAYHDAFRRDAHQLLAWGYQRAAGQINSAQEETDITGFIAEAIEDLIDNEAPPEYLRYCADEDRPFSSERRTGKNRKRLDIVIKDNGGIRPKPRYTFEAKRLRRKGHPLSVYLGRAGLRRFVTGEYASSAPEAAMLGYVQSETLDVWAEQLEEALPKRRTGLKLTQGLMRTVVVMELTHCWTSRHQRGEADEVTVCHILLNCAADSQPA